MTSKHEKAFREVYPNATIESQKTNGGKRYYLVRTERRAYMHSGSGDTKPAAWKAAASSLPVALPNAMMSQPVSNAKPEAGSREN